MEEKVQHAKLAQETAAAAGSATSSSSSSAPEKKATNFEIRANQQQDTDTKRMLQEGKKARKSREFEKAVETLAEALQIMYNLFCDTTNPCLQLL